MSRSVFAVLLVFLAATGAAAQAPPAETGWREAVTAAVRRATTQNPRVREAEARVEAARHGVAHSSVLPDPEIELGLKDVPVVQPSLSRSDFTMEMVTGRQRLPGRGKRPSQLAMDHAGVEGDAAIRAREAVGIADARADAVGQLA